MNIATDKWGYPHNFFFISQRGALLMSTHNICFCREIKDLSIFRMKKAPYLLLCMKKPTNLDLHYLSFGM